VKLTVEQLDVSMSFNAVSFCININICTSCKISDVREFRCDLFNLPVTEQLIEVFLGPHFIIGLIIEKRHVVPNNFFVDAWLIRVA
jgi:hypothetical protein